MAKHRHLTIAQPTVPGGSGACARVELDAGASTVSCAGGDRVVPDLELEPLLQVGDLARAAGKTVRAIHLYEDLGLLEPRDRSQRGRYRLFGSEALLRVRWIGKLQSLGLSLSQIQELVREQEDSASARFAASKLKQVYVDKLADTRAKIRELGLLQQELEASLAYLSTCDAACEPELPVDSCSACERHPEPERPPELIAGLRLH